MDFFSFPSPAGPDASCLPEPAVSLRLLERWYGSLSRWLRPFPAQHKRPLAYYGTGNHTTWSVQANATTFSGLAALAVAPELDERAAGGTREEIRDTALRVLRFILATHRSGGLITTSGEPWGHSWIAALGFTRMLHAIAMMKPHLEEADHDALKRLLLSECDFLLTGYPVVAAIDAATGRNKPESNIWNGTLLHRAAALYPDAPNAALYRQKSTELLLNGISIPSDATSDVLYEGKPLREWHVGPNFTEEYGLHHHRYLNVGYMVICLSNIAMAHYACEEDGIAPPPALYHHAVALWHRVKAFTFDDGRLWRIGGDTRVRYCYCQDYAVPMWVLAHDLWGDPAAARFLQGWLQQVTAEQQENSDGGFLTSRLADLARLSPLYYCRLEGDRAGTLSMAACWSRRIAEGAGRTPLPAPPPIPLRPSTAWEDEFHGASMVRGKRLASWVWKGAAGPVGTVLPADRSDLAEWEWNLAGRVTGAGCVTQATPERWENEAFPGGFLTHGSFLWMAEENPSEGSAPEKIARTRLVFAALPDDATVLLLQQARTVAPVYLTEATGLGLRIPNDLYNGSGRAYELCGAIHRLAGAGQKQGMPPAELLDGGDTIRVDGRITVTALYGGDLALRRPGRRQITLRNRFLQHSGQGGNLYCDEIILPAILTPAFHEKGALLYDLGAILTVDGAPGTPVPTATVSNETKSIEVTGQDGVRYLLVANFAPESRTVALPSLSGGAEKAEVLSGPPALRVNESALDLPADGVALLKLH